MVKQQRNYVSILGLADDVIMHCLEKSFESYLNRSDPDSFQVSPREAENSTSAILLIGAGLESYIRRLEYIILDSKQFDENKDIFNVEKCKTCERKKFLNIDYKISKIINLEFSKNHLDLVLKKKLLSKILLEFSELRNSIAHNYLYEFSVTYDESYDLESWNYTDLNRKNTGLKDDKTILFKFNKIPNQIGFIDVLKALLVFDLVITLLEKHIKGINYRFSGYHKLNGEYVQSISGVLEHYLSEICKNKKFKDALEINEIIVGIASELIQAKEKSTALSFEESLKLKLEISNIVDPTVLNRVSNCAKCGQDSLMIGKRGSRSCLNCSTLN